MIRILHVVSVMDVGGMESFIMNLYRHIDRNEIQFDFLVHHKRRGVFEEEIEALGGHVYHTSLIDDGNFPRYLKSLKALFRDHPEYRIVHGHLGSTAYWYLGAAEKANVPVRILHSHIASHEPTVKGVLKDCLFHFSPQHANVHFACSKEAGMYQFHDDSFMVIPNGIDVRHFQFCEERREKKRKELGLENKFVIGNVARFNPQKNHAFMIRVIAELKEEAPDAILLLLGTGALMEKTKLLASEMHVEDRVLFAGLQTDCAPFYQAMDAFILPSLFEGLPLTGIEAQCAGLACLFSDQISREVHLDPRSRFLPIEGECAEKLWAEALLSMKRELGPRPLPSDASWNYDSAVVAKGMTEKYQQLLENAS